jgi:hypothetical protein
MADTTLSLKMKLNTGPVRLNPQPLPPFTDTEFQFTMMPPRMTGLSLPTDPHSSGQHHPPITIRKHDRPPKGDSTPRKPHRVQDNSLFQIAYLADGHLGDAVIEVSQLDSGGVGYLTHTIELKNVRVLEVVPSQSSPGRPCEDVTLAFEEVIVNGVPNGIPIGII